MLREGTIPARARSSAGMASRCASFRLSTRGASGFSSSRSGGAPRMTRNPRARKRACGPSRSETGSSVIPCAARNVAGASGRVGASVERRGRDGRSARVPTASAASGATAAPRASAAASDTRARRTPAAPSGAANGATPQTAQASAARSAARSAAPSAARRGPRRGRARKWLRGKGLGIRLEDSPGRGRGQRPVSAAALRRPVRAGQGATAEAAAEADGQLSRARSPGTCTRPGRRRSPR